MGTGKLILDLCLWAPSDSSGAYPSRAVSASCPAPGWWRPCHSGECLWWSSMRWQTASLTGRWSSLQRCWSPPRGTREEDDIYQANGVLLTSTSRTAKHTTFQTKRPWSVPTYIRETSNLHQLVHSSFNWLGVSNIPLHSMDLQIESWSIKHNLKQSSYWFISIWKSWIMNAFNVGNWSVVVPYFLSEL